MNASEIGANCADDDLASIDYWAGLMSEMNSWRKQDELDIAYPEED